MTENATNYRVQFQPLLIAAAAAGLFLLAAGGGYRALSGQLMRADEPAHIPAGTLKELPLNIGQWVGRDQSLDEQILKRASVDDHLTRLYQRTTDHASVAIWIAYGIRARDLMPHRPEVCYPGAGWTLRKTDHLDFRVPDNQTVTARLLTFASGTVDPRPLVVLTYYIVDDETCEDVSLLRSKAWRGQTAIRYMTQIQISYRIETMSTASPETILGEFASETFPLIRALLENAARAADRGTAP
jgi:EpsI family protein